MLTRRSRRTPHKCAARKSQRNWAAMIAAGEIDPVSQVDLTDLQHEQQGWLKMVEANANEDHHEFRQWGWLSKRLAGREIRKYGPDTPMLADHIPAVVPVQIFD